jgi:hypothetical protein
MAINSIINEKTSAILIHDNSDKKLPIILEPNEYFGIVSIQLNETEVIQTKKMAVLFTIDCSASMSEKCENNQTKLDQAKYTLQKILVEFMKYIETTEVYVSVVTFDNEIHTTFDFIQLTIDNLEILIKKIQKIITRNSTNIEIALIHASEIIETFLECHPNTKMHHIQLTDGMITCGENNPDILLNHISDKYSNIFVGFGLQHDSLLLEILSSKKFGDYRFIDKIENSGFVYGEIIHNILYCQLESSRLVIEDGLLYNWKKNTWETELKLQCLSSGVKKEFQIKTTQPFDVNITLYGVISKNEKNNEKEECIFTMDVLPDLIDMITNEQIISQSFDLTKYAYRQLTQEMLYQLKNKKSEGVFDFSLVEMNNDTNDKNMNNTKELMNIIKEYIKENHLENDLFMKLLLDDLYVCYNNIGSEYENMCILGRQRSQGNQEAYTPTYIPKNHNNTEQTPYFKKSPFLKKLKLQRNNSELYNIHSFIKPLPCYPKNENENNDNESQENSIYQIQIPKDMNHIDNNMNLNTNIPEEEYTLNDYSANPYVTPKILKLMRNISST